MIDHKPNTHNTNASPNQINLPTCKTSSTSRTLTGPFGLVSFLRTRRYNHALLVNKSDSHNSRTEILDVAPLDIFTGMSKEIVENFLPGFVTEDMAKQALDIEFHWVTEHGQDGVLTAGATVKATVSAAMPCDLLSGANVDSTISSHALSWTSPSWEPTR